MATLPGNPPLFFCLGFAYSKYTHSLCRYGYHHERSAVEIFKDLLDDVNREFLSEDSRRAQEQRVGREISAATRQMISSVSFGQNCIIITKKTEEEYEYNERQYRYKKHL